MGASDAETIGRYAIYDVIAAGGMATVHFGRLIGSAGFSRTVAIKRLHENHAADPSFSAMLVDEARLVARIRHQNVVPTLDVIAENGSLAIVMEYVHGESLSRLAATSGERLPTDIAVAIVIGMLHGLDAAHDATSQDGKPLHIVHRDVSPQNVLVGVDGSARLVDFGVAKAAGRLHSTHDGALKGKVRYMAPEQLDGSDIDRRADVWAAGVVLWELLTGRALFGGDSPGATLNGVLNGVVDSPQSGSVALDAVTLRALDRDRDFRFPTARAFAVALEDAVPPATTRRVAEWVTTIAKTSLETREAKLARIESESRSLSVGSLRAEIARSSAPNLAEATSVDGRPGTGSPSPVHESVRTETVLSLPERPAPDLTTGGTRPRSSRVAPILIGTLGVALLFALAMLGVTRWNRPAPLTLLKFEWKPAIQVKPVERVVPTPPTPPTPPPNSAAPTTHRPTPKPKCDPPYWRDSNGIKHPKPGCWSP